MPAHVREWAEKYIQRGWQVVPLAPGSKECKDEGWLRLVFKPDDFKPDDNIGLRSVNGLVVIDEDCREAVAAADMFLPPTDAVYGRKSKPRSKRLYKSSFEKTIAFKDYETGETLLEIRANHQDMAPPSKHPEGELLAWEKEEPGDAGAVEKEKLLRASRLLASCAIISRYYNPAGSRHEWCLALSGMLRRLGLSEEDCKLVVSRAALWAHDDKVDDRMLEVKTTYSKRDDEPVKGTKQLKELSVVESLTRSLAAIWGSSSSAFILDSKGEKVLANNQENIRRAFDKMSIELSHDTFAEKLLIKYGSYNGPLSDPIVNKLWLEIEREFHFRPTLDYFFIYVQYVARQKPFHPVLDYLSKLEWDRKPRLETWLIEAAKATDSDYTRAVSKLVPIAAVRRVRKPGCKFDEMLVLESMSQGLNKSTALRNLCPNHDWFCDDLELNVSAKQIIEQTTGKWIVEASELTGIHRGQQSEHLKSMLSRQVDGPVRLAYARIAEERKRQFIFIGTTNSTTYLTDLTGNRRFWPVRIQEFNLNWIRLNRDQLWAEAAALEDGGESIRLDPSLYPAATIHQSRRLDTDPWEGVLRDSEALQTNYVRITYQHLYELIGVPRERLTLQVQARLNRVMTALGFEVNVTVRDMRDYKKVAKGCRRGDSLERPLLRESEENEPREPE